MRLSDIYWLGLSVLECLYHEGSIVLPVVAIEAMILVSRSCGEIYDDGYVSFYIG